MTQKDIIIITLLGVGLFFLLAPEESYKYLPFKFSLSIRQIIGCISLLGSYYYFNDEKLF